jgi:hypothetical protein
MLVSQHTTIKKDLELGLQNQKYVLTTLRNKFGDSLVETQDKYCKWDYTDSLGNHYEMKSRRSMKRTYPTTLLPCHKVMNTNVKQFYIFKFTDKLTFIEYNDELFNTFETGWITDGRTGKEDLHHYIPVELLIDI